MAAIPTLMRQPPPRSRHDNPLRVLHYNWVDPDDLAGRGGGVRSYMRALVAEQRRMPGYDVTTLASGLRHDLRQRPPRWQQIRSGHYEIVNARPLAPSQADFASPAQLHHAATEAALTDFLRATGPYDVVHFHTLEGLPARALERAAQLPGQRIILSLHNHHPFCPQVNLWWRETAHCIDNAKGARCRSCLPFTPNPHSVRRAYQLETLCARGGFGAGHWLHDRLLRPGLRRGWQLARRFLRRNATPALPGPENALRLRRGQMVTLINAHCTRVLAVSARTKAMAQGFGLDRVETLYIGTPHAHHWARSKPRVWPDHFSPARPLRLCYLGYMRADKGFPFLLQALAALPAAQAARVHLTVAARRGSPEMMVQMAALRGHLAALDWRDGYVTAELDGILAQADFGVVPSLWEDNLPQTALEMHVRHIPLITSDRGGAQELGGTALLRFRAGDVDDFAACLARVLEGDIDLRAYWAGALPPQDMAQHAQALHEHYEAMHEGTDPYRDPEIRHLVDPGLSGNEPGGAGRAGAALCPVQPGIRQSV